MAKLEKIKQDITALSRDDFRKLSGWLDAHMANVSGRRSEVEESMRDKLANETKTPDDAV